MSPEAPTPISSPSANMCLICSDIDQIARDVLSPRHLELFKQTKANEDLPGLGRHYCVECAKWFDTEFTLVSHRKGKPHKRQ